MRFITLSGAYQLSVVLVLNTDVRDLSVWLKPVQDYWLLRTCMQYNRQLLSGEAMMLHAGARLLIWHVGNAAG